MDSSRTTLRSGDNRGLIHETASRILRGLVLPILHENAMPGAGNLLEKLQKLEFSAANTLRDYQWDRIGKLLTQARESVPYYRQIFANHTIDLSQAIMERNLTKLPILTKSLLRERSKDLIREHLDPSQLLRNASGGSTGKPVEFFQDEEYKIFSHASRIFIQSWWGIKAGDAMASVWGADRDVTEWTLKERLYLALNQRKICNAFQMTEERMEKFARELQSWQPPFINGYATALEMFAQFLLERPQYKIRPRAVESSAETLTDKQRNVIERAFEAPVFNFYGSREVNNLAAECPAHEGLHVNSLTRYIEIVDDDGNPQAPGVPGRVLVTDLTNHVMPFIRYENEDIASWAERPCSCGRPFPLLERVWGRSSDFITTPSGKLIHGEYFTHLFYALPQVQTFQVAQRALTEVKVLIVLHPGVSAFNTEALRAQMINALGSGVDCTIEIVDAIPRTPSGKHRFTISSVPARWSTAMAGKD